MRDKLTDDRKGIAKNLNSPKLWWVVRISAIAGLAGLLVFFFTVIPGGQMHPAQARASYDETAYPPPDTPPSSSYPGPATETSQAPAGSSTPTLRTSTEPAKSLTPTVETTEALQPVTDTPVPSASATAFVTPTETMTPLPTKATQAVTQKKDGLKIDWGLFWIGFSLPILGGCGIVLYLLDRRPDIFKRLH